MPTRTKTIRPILMALAAGDRAGRLTRDAAATLDRR